MNAEHVIAKVNDLADGEMKQVEVGEYTLLLVRHEGQYRAYWPTCPHQGAELADGLLRNGRLRCPWHHTVFDAANGALLDPPATEPLPHFGVRTQGDDVVVALPDVLPEPVTPAMSGHDPDADGRTFVIVGSGAAGMTAAETLRQVRYKGRLVMLTADDRRPYDRTELSKKFLADPEASEPYMRGESFYQHHDIELHTNRPVETIDAEGRTVTTADGESFSYDKALIATGGHPRTLKVDGAELDGVLTLRSFADNRAIAERARQGGKAVIVGASFIGMEVASSLRKRGMDVAVTAPEETPFAALLGEKIGKWLQGQAECKSLVDFRLGRNVDHFEGTDRLEAVVLDDGTRLPADVCVVGIGIEPVTGPLSNGYRSADGGIPVDDHLRVCDDLYAAGDIASFPEHVTGQTARIEHWRVAMQQGRVAAMNMAGKDVPFQGVPFFWTSQFGVIFDYCGHAGEWDDILFDGDPQDGEFLALYVKDGKVTAAAGAMVDRKLCLAAELLRERRSLTAEELSSQLAEASAR